MTLHVGGSDIPPERPVQLLPHRSQYLRRDIALPDQPGAHRDLRLRDRKSTPLLLVSAHYGRLPAASQRQSSHP